MSSRWQYVHSCYGTKRNKANDVIGDYIVVNEKNVDTNKSRLRVIKNPTRQMWVTKPPFRNHSDKKEFSPLRELQPVFCKNTDSAPALANALGQYHSKWMNVRNISDSPYVYGSDIDIEVITKLDYRKKCPDLPTEYNVGSLDIETSVVGNDRSINLITYIDGSRKVYTAILRSFLKNGETIDTIKERSRTHINGVVDQFKERVLNKKTGETLADYIAERPFNVHYKICETELELIEWTFKQIHINKPDFIGIWNMQFDVGYMIDRLKFLGVNPADVMCHPEVPKEHRVCELRLDKTKVDHFTDRWDWLHISGYTQFVDNLALYSRLRKVKGRDIFYTLDYIANKELGAGKLKIGSGKSHFVMQTRYFLDYIGYNVIDTILLHLMEELNTDLMSLLGLIDVSLLRDFAKQTVQLKNAFFDYCLSKNCVPGSVGRTTMAKPHDEMIHNIGGTVLSPDNAFGTGVSILEEHDGKTMHHRAVCDIDVSSEYPNLQRAFNIARETKLSTIVAISGHVTTDIEDYCANVVAPDTNAVYVCSKFYGLPDHGEVLDVWSKYKLTGTFN